MRVHITKRPAILHSRKHIGHCKVDTVLGQGISK